MVVQLRGTSGSGKTTVVRAVIDYFGPEPDLDDSGHILGYRYRDERTSIYVVGDYDTSVCGGCDKIRTQDEICRRVREAAATGHVIFEGLLASTIFGRYVALAQDVAETMGQKFVFVLLDTPLEECITRVKRRRREAGNRKPLNEKGTRDKFELQIRHFNQFKEFGVEALQLSGDDAIVWAIRNFRNYHGT